MKKKLGYFQVMAVVSQVKRHGETTDLHYMQQTKDEPRVGQFRLHSDKIEFPKRRKGEKFFVKYTVMHQAEF